MNHTRIKKSHQISSLAHVLNFPNCFTRVVIDSLIRKAYDESAYVSILRIPWKAYEFSFTSCSSPSGFYDKFLVFPIVLPFVDALNRPHALAFGDPITWIVLEFLWLDGLLDIFLEFNLMASLGSIVFLNLLRLLYALVSVMNLKHVQ